MRLPAPLLGALLVCAMPVPAQALDERATQRIEIGDEAALLEDVAPVALCAAAAHRHRRRCVRVRLGVGRGDQAG